MCLDYVLRMLVGLMKENSFTLKKSKVWYPAQTISDEDHAGDIVLPEKKQ